MTQVSTLPRQLYGARQGGVGQAVLSVLLGVGFSTGIFFGMARFERAAPVDLPVEFADLRALVMDELPPPQEIPREQLPVVEMLSGIEALASESPVQIAVTPRDLEVLLRPPSEAPPATIQVGQLYSDLKPKIDHRGLGERIYQMAEVDQVPKVLNRVTPHVPSSVSKGFRQLRTSLLFVVDASGEIQNVRIAGSSGNAEFDAIIALTIREWSFSPAVRRGQKVRCLLQQAVTIKFSGSVLSL